MGKWQYQYRKSKKTGGVRITASKSGISMSTGAGPIRISRGADGKMRRTMSVPRTGLRKTDVIGGRTKSKAPTAAKATSTKPAAQQSIQPTTAHVPRYAEATRDPITLKVYLGSVTFDGLSVTVRKTARGSTVIPLVDLDDVLIVPAGVGMRGIWFSVDGELPTGKSHASVAECPRAVTFRSSRLAEFEQLRDAIDAQSLARQSPAPSQIPARQNSPPSQSSTSYAAAPAPTDPPAGWYTAPDVRDRLRYWDGQRWTEHTASVAEAPPPPH